MSTVACPSCNLELLVPVVLPADATGQCVCGALLRLSPIEAPEPVTSISFKVNDRTYTLASVDPYLSLNDWLRAQGDLSDTKKMCGEGGCGVCAVAVTYPADTNSAPNAVINSCLAPLASLDGAVITTTRGIGNAKVGYHNLQKLVADGNGSQCGACTPGMVMAMYSLMSQSTKPTAQQIEDQFDGNICRCTGYRPILEAFKTLAADADVDVTPAGMAEFSPCTSACQDIPEVCAANHQRVVKLTPLHAPIPTDVKIHAPAPYPKAPLRLEKNGVVWYRPASLADAYAALSKTPDARLVLGNTGTGIYKDVAHTSIIHLKAVPELQVISVSSTGVTFGAAVTLAAIKDWLEANKKLSGFFEPMLEHFRVLAQPPVRNAGSWAGNVMLAQKHGFPSDWATMCIATEATITYGPDSKTMPFETFLGTTFHAPIIVESMYLPFGNMGVLPDFYRSYKAMLRHENSHPVVNAGFKVHMNENNIIDLPPVIVYGGVGKKHTRATDLESYLRFKDVTQPDTFHGALPILMSEMIPDPSMPQVEYRKSLVMTFFYRFFLNLLPSIPPTLASGASTISRPVSSGVQTFVPDPSTYPASKAMPKIAATKQAAGEAVYVDDLPLPANGLVAAFVRTSAVGAITGIDASEALAYPGVAAFITSSDIPGVNDFLGEPIFVSTMSAYCGQAVGLILAPHRHHAEEAAKLVKITYNAIVPVVELNDAIKAGNFYPAPCPDVVVGDTAAAFAKSAHVVEGSVTLPDQYYFHMETQTCYATPTEDGIVLESATQMASYVQTGVATALNMQQSDVEVNVKRLGGAYGGKLDRSIHIAAAVSVAAMAVGQPVKCQMDIATNMEMVGRRGQHRADYKIGMDTHGKILGVECTHYHQNGAYVGMGGIVFNMMMTNVDSVYNIPNWKVTPKAVKTPTPTLTFCRAPGLIEAHFVMEHMLEQVAAAAAMDPADVRKANFYQEGQKTPLGRQLNNMTLANVWTDILTRAEVEARQKSVKEFNDNNKWQKKGLSLVPMKYDVDWAGVTFSALVSILPDGSVQVTHGGIEMGQGINTKVAQVAAYILAVDLSKISVKTTRTQITPNCSPTGGSVGSGVNCAAVKDACFKLKNTLDAVKKGLRAAQHGPSGTPWAYRGKTMEEISWEDSVTAALAAGADLSARGFISGVTDDNYESYGAALAEVLVDVLTGEVHVMRADIVFDCGISLNPDVDIGQVEGSFVMGMGHLLTEHMSYEPASGHLVEDGTWEYKPPSNKDIPVDFRVNLLPNAPNHRGVLRSKASGEPPLLLAASVFFATQNAVAAYRHLQHVELPVPATPEVIQLACRVTEDDLVLA